MRPTPTKRRLNAILDRPKRHPAYLASTDHFDFPVKLFRHYILPIKRVISANTKRIAVMTSHTANIITGHMRSQKMMVKKVFIYFLDNIYVPVPDNTYLHAFSCQKHDRH